MLKKIAKKLHTFEKENGGKVFLLSFIAGVGLGMLYLPVGGCVIIAYICFLVLCGYGQELKHKEKEEEK